MIGAPQRDSEERSINAIKQDTASVTGTRAFSSAWQRERGQASGWTHEIQTNPIHWETSGPLGATLQGHGQKFKGFILGKYAWKISLLTPPPNINATFLRLSSWFIDKTPPTFYGLWTTRHGVANGMETSWLQTGGEAQSPPSALSVERFCPIRGHAPHPI